MKTQLAAIVLGLTFMACYTPTVSAQETEGHAQCQKDIAALTKRLEKLEQELERVKLTIKLKANLKAEPTPWILRKKVIAQKAKAAVKAVPKEQTAKRADKSINAALQWLTKKQQKNGSWKGNKPSQSLIVTSNAVTVFINNGHTHRFGDHQAIILKTLKYLLSRQNADGWFQSSSINPSFDLLSHCEATNAIAYLFAVSRDFKLKKSLMKARDALLRAELADGAWSSSGAGKADAFVSAQVLNTFKQLSLAQIKLPIKTINNAINILADYTNKSGLVGQFSAEDNGAVAPKGSENDSAHPLTTAIATLNQLQHSSFIPSKSTSKSLVLLSSQNPIWSKDSVDLLHWFSTTRALSQKNTKKKYGQVWRQTLFELLVRAQNKNGAWPTIGPWGRHYGPVWTTALAARTLKYSLWK